MYTCVEQARAGDRFATDLLVRSLRPRISRMALYYARRTGEDPDDLLQEAWVGLLEALPTVDLSIGVPEQFLIQRARWRMLDSVKRARVRRCSSLDEAELERIPSYEPSVEAGWIDEFTRQLKTTQRAVLGHLLAGRTWRETGALLGCTSANIAHHVRQIRRQYERWSGESTQVDSRPHAMRSPSDARRVA